MDYGQSAPNPVISTLKYFRKEFEEHAIDKQCRALECKAMSKITINEEKCKGCRTMSKTLSSKCDRRRSKRKKKN